MDMGRHTVCVRATDKFLSYSKSVGNDLSTPMPQYHFPGLKEGDIWCLHVVRSKYHNPRAIFVSYESHERAMAATSRIRTSFGETPIYTRAQSRLEAEELKSAGDTEVVVEMDELPRSSPYFLLDGSQHDDGEGMAMPIRNLLNATESISKAHT
ncbi:hypothetical protein ACHAWF_001697 [Thalassiosira exigua]